MLRDNQRIMSGDSGFLTKVKFHTSLVDIAGLLGSRPELDAGAALDLSHRRKDPSLFSLAKPGHVQVIKAGLHLPSRETGLHPPYIAVSLQLPSREAGLHNQRDKKGQLPSSQRGQTPQYFQRGQPPLY